MTNVEEAPTSPSTVTVLENEPVGTLWALTLADPDKVPVLITEGATKTLGSGTCRKAGFCPAIGQHGIIYATTGVADERVYGLMPTVDNSYGNSLMAQAPLIFSLDTLLLPWALTARFILATLVNLHEP